MFFGKVEHHTAQADYADQVGDGHQTIHSFGDAPNQIQLAHGADKHHGNIDAAIDPYGSFRFVEQETNADLAIVGPTWNVPDL